MEAWLQDLALKSTLSLIRRLRNWQKMSSHNRNSAKDSKHTADKHEIEKRALVAWLREPQVALFSELRGQATSSTEAQRVTSDKSSGGSFPGCTFDLSRSTRVEQTDPEEIMLQKVQRSILLKQWRRSALCLPSPTLSCPLGHAWCSSEHL